VIPVLETERLRLREWRETDFEPFAAIYADEAQCRFIGGPQSRAEAWRKMALFAGHWPLRGYGQWALEDKATGAFAGWAGPWNPEGHPEAEIGWTLTLPMRGKGLAQEAARRARAHVYETLGWDTVTSLIAVDNAPSARVAERLGAALERVVPYRGLDCAIWRHPSPRSLSSTSTRTH
jgi:RimJ/RimL family protein N-acetyltransferase